MLNTVSVCSHCYVMAAQWNSFWPTPQSPPPHPPPAPTRLMTWQQDCHITVTHLRKGFQLSVFGFVPMVVCAFCVCRVFLCDLEQCGVDPVKVAECFVRHNTGFVIYTDYCTNYPR